MKIHLLFAQVALALGLSFSAQAALTFESDSIDLHPTLNDKTAVAHFKYKNDGDKPVKITSVHPSCGCTTAKLEKDTVAPKESGEIVATFTIGDRAGVQTKTITVVTDDTPTQPTQLTLKATIPQVLQVTPTFIYWSADDVLEPKTINVTVGGDFAVTKLDITSTDKAITTEVKKESDKTFKVLVRSTEAGRPINAALKIQPDFPKEPQKTFYANVRVDSRAKMPPKK